MPTTSQCQVLSLLIRRETQRNIGTYHMDDDEDEGAVVNDDTVDVIPVPNTAVELRASGSSPVPGRTGSGRWGTRERFMRAATIAKAVEQPNLPTPVDTSTGNDSTSDGAVKSVFVSSHRRNSNAFIPRSRTPTFWGRRWKEKNSERTEFQQQCMDMVERSLSPQVTVYMNGETVVKSALRSKTPDADTQRPKSAMETRQDTIMHVDPLRSAESRDPLQYSRYSNWQRVKPNEIVSEDEGRAVTPVSKPMVRFNSSVKVFENIQQQLLDGKAAPAGVIKILDADVEQACAATEKLAAGLTSVGEEAGTDGEDADERPNRTTMFIPIVCTDEMREKLYEMGWRKPLKPAKKKKKPKNSHKKNNGVDLSNLPSLFMDLKKDPILRKARKARVVPIQTKPPDLIPTAVCFSMVGSLFTHRDVWLAVKRDILHTHPEVRIQYIQFVPRAIFVRRPKGSEPIEDRWVINLTSEWFRNRVTGMELTIKGQVISLKRYDDVVTLEYRQYTRMKDYMKMLNFKK